MHKYTEEYINKLWEVLPKEALWLAVDKDCKIYWYQCEPDTENSYWSADNGYPQYLGKVQYDGDWKDTLRQRPKKLIDMAGKKMYTLSEEIPDYSISALWERIGKIEEDMSRLKDLVIDTKLYPNKDK